MKERYFWVAIGLIAISWIFNSLYANSKQLKEPVFLDHYIEATMGDNNYITFYYLTNESDLSRISFVNLGGVTGYIQNDFFYMDASYHNIDTFTHHALRSITVQLQDLDLGDEDMSFKEMDVFFTNGNQYTVSIGEVIIHPAGYFESDGPDALQQSSGGGTSDGRSWHSFTATEQLSIQKISAPFNNALGDQLNLSITGSQIQKDKTLDSIQLPIHLDEGKHVTVAMQLDQTSSDIPSSFFIRLSGTTAKGVPFTNYGGYNSQPYLTQEDVNRIIQEKTGRD